MNELSGLRTETGKVFELDPGLKMGQYALEARTGPIHFKESYKDADHWLDMDETYSEAFEIKGIGKVLIYPKLPNIVTVYQDKCGYEIQSRSNPDHVAKVELVSINGVEVSGIPDTDLDISAFVKIHPFRVGLWKQFKRARAIPWVLKWRVTELGKPDKDTHPFSFRTTPEAFTVADIRNLNPLSRDAARVAIGTLRERINDASWYWYETIPRDVMLVDTDFQSGASSDDCQLYYNGSNWQWYGLEYSAIYAGFYTSNWRNAGGGMRFSNVAISYASTINTAKIKFRADVSLSGTSVNTKLTGHKVANSSAFTDLADYQARRGTVVGGANNNYITSQVSWNGLSAWTANTWYDSASIVTPMTEIIGVSGWTRNNAMTFFWDDHDNLSTNYRQAKSYDAGSSNAPTLVATWTEPVRKGPRIYVPNVSWLSKSLHKRKEI